VVRSMLAGRVSHVETVTMDWWVLAFNAALAAATGVLSGMASLVAVTSRGFDGSAVGASRSVTSRTWLRHGVLAAEIAVVFILVSTAALLSQTLWNLHRVKRGFDADRLLTAGVMPGMSGTIPELQSLTSHFFNGVIEQVGRVPGVESVAAASTVPFSGPTMGMSGVSIIGGPQVGEMGGSVSVGAVTPEYFSTMGVRLVAGRDFTRLDLPDRDRVAVVNEAFVRSSRLAKVLPGTQIQFGRSRLTVIGIAEDTPDTSLRQPARPFVYVPMAQMVGTEFVFGRLTILVRARGGDPAALIPTLRDVVWGLGHTIVIDEVTTMHERVAAAVRTERDSALLFGLLAAIAVLVAIAGVYGVVAYSVSRRTREMGIRIALGARHGQVIGEIVRESAWPVMAGIAIGLAGAAVAARAVASVLFGVEPTDPLTYVATALALSLTALTAAWIAARRAGHVDPVAALRAE
jgi:predicted permease